MEFRSMAYRSQPPAVGPQNHKAFRPVPNPISPEERRASVAHYALRRLMFTDPAAWAKKMGGRTAQAARSAPKAPKAVDLPELDTYEQRRLWSHVRRGKPEECWPWQGATGSKGYGRFKVGGRLYLPHRLVYAFTKGPILNAQEHHGSVVMHSCDNPACCNPKHLTLGRQVENVGDMMAKGRHARQRKPPLP